MSKTYIAHEILGGIHENTVKMTVDRRLRYAPYAQAGWRDGMGCECDRETGEFIRDLTFHRFYSYSSLIFTAVCDMSGAVQEIHTGGADAALNFSRTTSAQTTKALQELGIVGGAARRVKSELLARGWATV